MADRLFFMQTNRALDLEGDPVPGARAFFFKSGTSTPFRVYADRAATVRHPIPLVADGAGIFPEVFTRSSELVKVIVQDAAAVMLPGYPIDPVVSLSADEGAASQIGFDPTEEIPEDNVQEAIERVQENIEDITDVFDRSLTPILTTVSGNDYEASPSPAITSYEEGKSFLIRVNRDNTGAATLDLGPGNRDWRKYDEEATQSSLAAGDIKQGSVYLVYYDGFRFITTLDHSPSRIFENEHGFSVRHPNGIQECHNVTNLARDDLPDGLGRLKGNWNFPQDFAALEDLVVIAMERNPDLSKDYAPEFSEITNLIVRNLSVSSCDIWAFRVGGGTDFVSGDSMTVSLYARGRW
jgi:hypothetical protein